MKKKIKIIDLLCLISNGEEVPKKIIYRNVPMIYDNGTEDYMPHQTDKFHGNDLFHYLFEEETKIFLNDEVEILDDEEDKDIPLIPDDELWFIEHIDMCGVDKNSAIDYNFKVLKEKINQVIEEFNEYRKENE
jgi:hypothetical protein